MTFTETCARIATLYKAVTDNTGDVILTYCAAKSTQLPPFKGTIGQFNSVGMSESDAVHALRLQLEARLQQEQQRSAERLKTITEALNA